MTDASPPAAGGAGSRRLKVALIASLALNLLIVGAVAGTMWGMKKHHPRAPSVRGEDFGLMSITRDLPPERRKELRKQLRDDRASLRPLIEEIRAARREAADRLAAEPFDRAALESAIAAVAEKQRALRQAAVTAFVGHAERLTPEERRLLAERWRKKSEGFHRRRTKDAKDETPAAPAPSP